MTDHHEHTLFRLFANCIPVRGARRSIICDLQTGRCRLIPNGLYSIITEARDQTPAQVKALYESRYHDIIDSYYEALIREGYGFWCTEPDRFPDLGLAWDSPAAITNAIIDVGARSDHRYGRLFEQLEELGCRALQLRFFQYLRLPAIEGIVACARDHSFRHLDLTIKAGPDTTPQRLREFCVQQQLVSRIMVHSAEADELGHGPQKGFRITYHRAAFNGPGDCGHVHPRYFAVTMEHVTEALHFNTCLNRKVCIGADGQIRNCPAMDRIFGDANEVLLKDIVSRPDFKALWRITKDMVNVCCECEFRYICTDCRAVLADESCLLSKPRRCGYDPYTASWASTAGDRSCGIADTGGVTGDCDATPL